MSAENGSKTFRLRRWTYELLDPSPDPPPFERAFNIALAILIALNVFGLIVETVPDLPTAWAIWLKVLRGISIAVFGVEYLGRLWVSPLRPGAKPGIRGYWDWATTPLAIVDLLVFLSLAVPAMDNAIAALRGIRLLKLLSLLKLGRISPSLRLVGYVLRERWDELRSIVVMIAVLVTIAASLLYAVEADAGTKGFESIPAAMWWAIVTLTTTGYGDVFPVTTVGRLLAALIMLLGIGVVALPAGIVAAGFAEAIKANAKKDEPDPRLRDLQDTMEAVLPHLPEGPRRVAEQALARSRED